MALACRNCRVPLTAQVGCAICNDIRPHLISTDEMADLAPSLAEVGSESVAALRTQVRVHKQALRDDALALDTDLNKTLVLLTNAVAKVLEAARKLQDDGIAAVRNMSFIERAKLFIGWFASLPPNYRVQVKDQIEKFELEINKPLELDGAR
jgi:hypothetical protein